MRYSEIKEMEYEGNIGIMELSKFFREAPPELVRRVQDLIDRGQSRAVWRIVQDTIGSRLTGAQFNEAQLERLVRDLPESLDVPTPSIEHIAHKHRVSTDQIKTQLAKGVKVELEHTTDHEVAREIALDHLNELPDYYDRLARVEGGNQNLDEAFNQPYPIRMTRGEFGDYDGNVRLPDGSNLEVNISLEYQEGPGKDVFDVIFHRGGTTSLTGDGDAFRVFATVMEAIRQFVTMYRRDSADGKSPYMMSFTASKNQADVINGNTQSRFKLYNRMITRFAAQMGYVARSDDHSHEVEYELIRKR